MTENTSVMWEEVREKLKAFIAKRVANKAEVEDLLQEVFLRMYRKLDSLKDPQRLRSWLFQITRHAIIDHSRASARQRELSVGLAGDLKSSQQHSALGRSDEDSDRLRTELAGCLRPMLERLSTQYRDALTFVELEGLTQRAAAARLGLSVSGMKSRVQRGRRQLKSMLEECCVIQLDRRNGVAGYSPRDASCQSCHPPSRQLSRFTAR
jgi:RNA polymerase sigma-70 factor, ECF subfamily